MKLKKPLFSITIEESYPEIKIMTSFTIGCYPTLTVKQAKEITKILYPKAKFVELENLIKN